MADTRPAWNELSVMEAMTYLTTPSGTLVEPQASWVQAIRDRVVCFRSIFSWSTLNHSAAAMLRSLKCLASEQYPEEANLLQITRKCWHAELRLL
jgi:hypothetical protein